MHAGNHGLDYVTIVEIHMLILDVCVSKYSSSSKCFVQNVLKKTDYHNSSG